MNERKSFALSLSLSLSFAFLLVSRLWPAESARARARKVAHPLLLSAVTAAAFVGNGTSYGRYVGAITRTRCKRSRSRLDPLATRV